MKAASFLTAFLATVPLLTTAQQSLSEQYDTWVCHDGLGRTVVTSDDGVIPFDNECQVGIFYYLWHGQHGDEIKDITRLLEANPDNPAWGSENQFHWGGKPALNYYKGGDTFIVARHMQMLMDAGVDFYFFDVTNAFDYPTQVQVVMNEIDRREKLGLRTPKLVFTLHSNCKTTMETIYERWYKDEKYNKYWFMWNDKPLILVNEQEFSQVAFSIRKNFTIRYCWAWETGEKRWPWLAYYPQQRGYSTSGSVTTYEQISVATAMHAHTKIGKSYHNGKQPTISKYGLCAETSKGLFFQEQFDQALKYRPKVTMITQWNEWMAQRFVTNSSTKNYTRPGATPKAGESYFIDVYNQEFSRDIEPSSESLIRDNYYMQMVSNVRKLKGVHTIPTPATCKTINVNTTDLSQWDDVQPTFLDEEGDVKYTSSTAQKSACLKRTSADIISAKVTKDADSLYFLANTVNVTPIATDNKVRWMSVLIDADCQYETGWEGYDFMLTCESSKFRLYAYDKGEKKWKLQDSAVRGKRLSRAVVYAVSRAALGLQDDVDFDFKWIDNMEASTTDILDFYANGEAAPNTRFAYRYKGSLLITPPTAIPTLKENGKSSISYDLSGRRATNHSSLIIQDGKKMVR